LGSIWEAKGQLIGADEAGGLERDPAMDNGGLRQDRARPAPCLAGSDGL
jgi:hypothetical protein